MDEEQLLTLGRILIGLSDSIKSSMLARVKAMGCSVQYALEVVGIKLKLSLDEDVVMMLDCVPFTYDLRHVWSNVMKIDVLSGKVLLNEIESIVKGLLISGSLPQRKSPPPEKIITHLPIEFQP